MKTNEQLLPALILAAGIAVAGLALRSGIVAFKDRDRTVSVRGLAEREVKANKVTWPLIYREMGDDPAEIYHRMAEKNRLVVAFLKKGGVKDEEISLNPPKLRDSQADNYNERALYRYTATGVVTVTSTEVDRVRQLMRRQGELMTQGVAIVTGDWNDNSVTYEFTGLNDIKPAMVEEATKNARAAAEKFAEDSGSRLGSIRTASQGLFSIDDRDENTPYIKRVRVVNTVDYALD